MKITNKSKRLYYVAGQKLIPGQTAEIDDSWKEIASVKTALDGGELELAKSDTEVDAAPVEKSTKSSKADN